jgi:uncharacterized protein (DUF58 family)
MSTEPTQIRARPRRDGRVYILPTFFGLFFLLVLAIFFVAAFAFDNDFTFVLVFALFGFFLVSMFHVHYNLAGIEVESVRTVSRFTGGLADVVVTLRNPSRRTLRNVIVAIGNGKRTVVATVDEIAPRGAFAATLKLPLTRRGRFAVPAFRLSTAYPAGLFRSWMNRSRDAEYRAFPAPRGGKAPSNEDILRDAGTWVRSVGSDDFHGHRPYQRGDPPRHVDWKAFAKGRPPQTKVFGQDAGASRLFRWRDTDASASVEDRLSQLSSWVETSFRARRAFGLSLPAAEIPVGEGISHRERCMRALADFDGGNGEDA